MRDVDLVKRAVPFPFFTLIPRENSEEESVGGAAPIARASLVSRRRRGPGIFDPLEKSEFFRYHSIFSENIFSENSYCFVALRYDNIYDHIYDHMPAMEKYYDNTISLYRNILG